MAKSRDIPHRVWVEIDLGAIRRNYARIAKKVAPSRVLCVLKANAYGLGVANYARALAGTDCAGFGVAEPYEALELKKELAQLGVKKELQILSSVLPEEIPSMVEAGVTLPLIDLAEAHLINNAALKVGKPAKVHIKVDSGMGRLGIPIKEVEGMLVELKALKGLKVEGIFTHCPMAYVPNDPYTQDQIKRFVDCVEAAQKKGGATFKYIHMAASDAINNYPRTAKKPFNVVRTGINLHGSFDPNGRRALKVEPVLALKTRVAQVRTLPAGTTLGYGRTWCLAETTRIATISAGYADGLPLALSNRGQVLINGVRCPIVGRISMDYTTVDVSHVSNVAAGDEVVCFGKSGKESITPDDWATIKGTHAYDIICSLGGRVKRVAVGDAAKVKGGCTK